MFLNDIHEVKNQIESEGFCILKNLVSKDLINNFSSVIEEIEKDNNKYQFKLNFLQENLVFQFQVILDIVHLKKIVYDLPRNQ